MPESPDTEGVEFTGKGVDEALARGLAELGLPRDQVDVTVLSEGRPGILGVGAQPARIVLTPKPAAAPPTAPASIAAAPVAPSFDEPVGPVAEFTDLDDDFINQGADAPAATLNLDLTTESALDVLETLLQFMSIDGHVSVREPETAGDGLGMVTAVLDVTSLRDEDAGLLIGRRGETLASLQYVLNLIVNHQTRSHTVFGVDVEGYRRRREAALCDLARRVADRVRQNGQAMTLEPMPPAERRIVHITLADDPDVETVSIGEGESRKVAITLKH
jgi:spoIIIJ-associated protein